MPIETEFYVVFGARRYGPYKTFDHADVIAQHHFLSGHADVKVVEEVVRKQYQ